MERKQSKTEHQKSKKTEKTEQMPEKGMNYTAKSGKCQAKIIKIRSYIRTNHLA